MIKQFIGEFLFDPCPLEMSMNVCSHGCAYCFSCNRGYVGWNGMDSVKRQIARLKGQESTLAFLVNNGYPIVLSNRSDPFAKSNRQHMPELIRLLKQNGIPVFIQTKGGDGLELCASKMDKSLFYFTISYWNDDTRARVEPNAPSVDGRLEHIRNVIGMGHSVIVGITPMDENWLPVDDFRSLATALKSLGVKGVFMQGLHISGAHKLSDSKKAAMFDAIGDTGKSMANERQFEYYQKCVSILDEIGLCGYGVGQWKPSKFMDAFRDAYEKTFPVTDDFIRWTWDNKKTGDHVSFDEYFEVIGARLPGGMWRLRDMIYAVARNMGSKDIPAYMTFKDYLKIVWSDDRHLQCPSRFRLFAFDGVDRGNRKLDTENGLPLMLVNKDGFERGQRFSERRKK